VHAQLNNPSVKSGAISRISGSYREYVCYAWDPARTIDSDDPLVRELQDKHLAPTESELDHIQHILSRLKDPDVWMFASKSLDFGDVVVPCGSLYKKAKCRGDRDRIKRYLERETAGSGIVVSRFGAYGLCFIWQPE